MEVPRAIIQARLDGFTILQIKELRWRFFLLQ